MKATKSRIRNPEEMKKVIDFKDLNLDGHIYPTDIDGIIEYKDSEYIIFEMKYGDKEVPIGQRLAIQRMVDDFTKAGKNAVAFICRHTVKETDTPIIAAWCKVSEMYYGEDKEWRCPSDEITVKEAVAGFQTYSKLFNKISKE